MSDGENWKVWPFKKKKKPSLSRGAVATLYTPGLRKLYQASYVEDFDTGLIKFINERTGVTELEQGKPAKKKVYPDWPPKPEKWWEDET